jgi:hypothetical protein
MGRTGQNPRRAICVPARRPVSLQVLAVSLCVAAAAVLHGAEEARPVPPATSANRSDAPTRRFRIGYLRPGKSSVFTREWFRALRRFLESDSATSAALVGEGYGGVAIVAAEGFNDLVRRMDNRELECVFCPAKAYCDQISSYTVVFQIKGPLDSGRRGQHILQNGAIVVNSSHGLYREPGARQQEAPPHVIAPYFRREPVALVSRYSAPGYIYPLMELVDSGQSAWPNQPVFCGSSEDVVKMVLSDVVSIGACEEGVAKQALARFGQGCLDILLVTDGCPSDPVVFHERFRLNRSDLGRRLEHALKRFFAERRPPGFQLVESDDSAFDEIKDVLAEFREKAGAGVKGP